VRHANSARDIHDCHEEIDMADKTRKTRLELLAEFAAAPSSALFASATVAAVRGCTTGNIERDRWLGRGVPFIRIGHTIRYSKRDILAWLSQYQAVRSTAEADAQSMQLREVCHE
jgi:hypothetical protein